MIASVTNQAVSQGAGDALWLFGNSPRRNADGQHIWGEVKRLISEHDASFRLVNGKLATGTLLSGLDGACLGGAVWRPDVRERSLSGNERGQELSHGFKEAASLLPQEPGESRRPPDEMFLQEAGDRILADCILAILIG
jgi:hypothetical protein